MARTLVRVALACVSILLYLLAIVTHVAYNDGTWTAIFHVASTVSMASAMIL